MNKIFKAFKVLILILAFLLPGYAFSQGPDFNPNDCGFLPDEQNDNVICPIDGGVSFLVAAAVGFGLKKANDKKKLLKAPQKVI